MMYYMFETVFEMRLSMEIIPLLSYILNSGLNY